MESREAIIQRNLRSIRSRIQAAAQRSGREPNTIGIVAVTKNVPLNDIRAAIQSGIQILGENKVQEATRKFSEIGPAVSWHMIGHLQTNKARHAAAIFDLVQSIDSQRAALALNQEAGRLDRQMDVLIEVNIGADEKKFGISPEETQALVDFTLNQPHLRVRGLMAMAPYVTEPELVRPFFHSLAQLHQTIQKRVAGRARWDILSMGMSHDFEVAVEEGATLVRIGTALFHTPDLRSDA